MRKMTTQPRKDCGADAESASFTNIDTCIGRQCASPSHPALRFIAAAIRKACARNRTLDKADRIANVLRFVDAGAWTEAVLALIELEHPRWRLRRLAMEDGEWFCCLSERPDLPLELDETAEVHDRVLPLAILKACAEARESDSGRSRNRAFQVPRGHRDMAGVVVCDNFA